MDKAPLRCKFSQEGLDRLFWPAKRERAALRRGTVIRENDRYYFVRWDDVPKWNSKYTYAKVFIDLIPVQVVSLEVPDVQEIAA